jgi:16S rRNA (cytidine1402-2'-O)-methyltransferase
VPGPPGRLYVVGTPIGNLEDLSFRAIATLRDCRLIACEDTRVTRAILTRHGLTTPLVSCHKFNERSRIDRVLEVLAAGGDVALVSDGGTPGLSDPGALLVHAARAAGYAVSPIPGPSAASALISVSGFTDGTFTFLGFLPSRRGERRRALEALRNERRPMLFFESPHRILGTLEDAEAILGDRVTCLGREMTKLHEEILDGPLSVVRSKLSGRRLRGEFAFLLAGADAAGPGERHPTADPGGGPSTGPTPGDTTSLTAALTDAAAEVRGLIATGIDRGAALRQVARRRGLNRREIYRQLVRDRDVGTIDPPRGTGEKAEEEE